MGTVKFVRLEFPATLLAMGMALAATPALSQGAMTPRPDVAPRVAPAPAPQAPVVVPQAPVVVPQVPVVTPLPSTLQPGPRATDKGGAGIKDKPLEHQEVSTTRLGSSPGSGTPTTGGPVVPQRTAGTPLQGTPVGLEGEPGGFAAGKGKTDAQGNITFKDLKPGRYAIICCDDTVPAAQFLTVSTSVNGKLQSRADFPVGSSVGTFTVSSIKDTITLKLESNSPAGNVGGPAAPAGIRGGFIIPLIALVGPSGASVGTGKTDTTGQLAFQNLPAGRYTARLQGKDLPAGTTGPVTVVATVNGKETARKTFDVPAGGASSRSLDLPIDVGPPPAGSHGSIAVVAIILGAR